MPCAALGCPSRVVAPPCGTRGELLDERAGGEWRAGDDDQARAASVEAVDDPRSNRVADVGEHAETMQQPVDQRPVRVPGTGMDDHPGRLVDDHDVVVLEDDLEADRRICRRRLSTAGWPTGRPPRTRPRRGGPCRRRRFAVHLHAAGGDGRRGDRAADVGEQGDHPVEALTGECGGDALFDHSGLSAGATSSAGGRSVAQHEQHATGRHGDVGDVEDRPPLHVDEVDHRAAEPARGCTEKAVDEVAHHAPDDQPDGHGGQIGLGRSGRSTRAGRRPRTGRRCRSPGRGRCPGHPGVEHEVEPQRADEVDVAVGERVQRPLLRQLVDHDDARGDRQGPARRPLRAITCGRCRRPSPRPGRSPTGSPRGAQPRDRAGRHQGVAVVPSAKAFQGSVDVGDRLARLRRQGEVGSRSTTIVSPSPLSSSNCTSPISPSSMSELASSSSRFA